MSLQAILKQAMSNESATQAIKEMATIKELQDVYAQGHIVVIDFNFEGQTFGYSLKNSEPSEFYQVAKDVVKYGYTYKVVKQDHLHNDIKRVYSFDEVYDAYYGRVNKRILAHFGEDHAVVLKFEDDCDTAIKRGNFLKDYVTKDTDFNKVIIAIID